MLDVFKRQRDQVEEDRRRSILTYRSVFLDNPNGRAVLNSILQGCGLLKRIENDEQRVLHNWGVYLLANMGLETVSATGMIDYGNVIDAIARITVTTGKGAK